jgi:hypothetical protein
MNMILDIMGSSIIASIVFLLILKLNIYSDSAKFYSDNDLKLQQNAKTLAEIINYDFRKIGYNYEGTSIIAAQPKYIKFYADMNEPGTPGYGTVDVIEYYLGDSTEVTATPNPRDKILYRVENTIDTIGGPSLGLIDIRFSYLNSKGLATTFLDSIKYVKAELWVEPYEKSVDYFTGQTDSTHFTYWELTINPRNI